MSTPFIINKYTTREQLREWYGVKKDKFREMCCNAGVPDRQALGAIEISCIIMHYGHADSNVDIQIPIEENYRIWQQRQSA